MNHVQIKTVVGKRLNELIPAADQCTKLLGQAVSEINEFYDSLDQSRVSPDINAETIRSWLDQFDFTQPQQANDLVGEVAKRMKSWNLHTPHPRYFGLFNPAPSLHGMVADLLVAGFNPQLGAWHHSPFAVEVEAHLIRYFAGRFGLGVSAFEHFTSGGSEANFSAVVVALTRSFPAWAHGGARAVAGQPVIYCSEEFHHSFVKIAHQCGLGRAAVHLVPVTKQCVMDVQQLQQIINEDRRQGLLPFMVVATAGTTNAGLIEPLADIGQIARNEQLHMHVDAAWGGAVILSDKYQSLLAGIEMADTITFDPHKLLSVPMGAGMFLVRDRSWLRDSFGLKTDYVPESPTDDLDNYRNSFQFSRRFIGLKLFLALSALGRDGVARALERQLTLARVLASKLEQFGFQVLNGASLGVVCFVPPENWGLKSHAQFEHLAEQVCQTGQAWISSTKLGGRSVLRACVTNHLTNLSDLDFLVELLLSMKSEE